MHKKSIVVQNERFLMTWHTRKYRFTLYGIKAEYYHLMKIISCEEQNSIYTLCMVIDHFVSKSDVSFMLYSKSGGKDVIISWNFDVKTCKSFKKLHMNVFISGATFHIRARQMLYRHSLSSMCSDALLNRHSSSSLIRKSRSLVGHVVLVVDIKSKFLPVTNYYKYKIFYQSMCKSLISNGGKILSEGFQLSYFLMPSPCEALKFTQRILRLGTRQLKSIIQVTLDTSNDITSNLINSRVTCHTKNLLGKVSKRRLMGAIVSESLIQNNSKLFKGKKLEFIGEFYSKNFYAVNNL